MSISKKRQVKKLERRYARLLGQLQQLKKAERKFGPVKDSAVFVSLVERRKRVEVEAAELLSEIARLRSS